MTLGQAEGKRRIDRILHAGYLDGLGELPLAELRQRRDESLAEREYLSFLRRLLHGRIDILKAEAERRCIGQNGKLVDRLPGILASPRGSSRGEALRMVVPQDGMLRARRRVERILADAQISDPVALSDTELAQALEVLVREERRASSARAAVIAVLDRLQDELKRRYKEDLSRVLVR